jgi:hypothetical protein
MSLFQRVMGNPMSAMSSFNDHEQTTYWDVLDVLCRMEELALRDQDPDAGMGTFRQEAVNKRKRHHFLGPFGSPRPPVGALYL